MSDAALFHKTLKLLRGQGIQGEKILVGFSAGLDSMALLDVLSRISPLQKLSLLGIHIDHGEALEPAMRVYRKEAKKRAAAFCASLSIPCLIPPPPEKPLKSEADFRDFRRGMFRRFLRREGAGRLALAHNSDDLLETRLIHLVRGCGEEGLRAMSVLDPPFLRPFLPVTREEIKSYAQSRRLRWLEDPSNADERFFRNWIRLRWLPALEAKRPGAGRRLAGSLDNAASLIGGRPLEGALSRLAGAEGLDRALFQELSLSEQKRALAFYMRKRGLRGYGQSHIEEILRHLQRREKRFSFKMLKRLWKADGRLLRVED